jgi:hypothetical protein
MKLKWPKEDQRILKSFHFKENTMTAVLTETIHITEVETFLEDGFWWVSVCYSDGGKDVFGPALTEDDAERLVF